MKASTMKSTMSATLRTSIAIAMTTTFIFSQTGATSAAGIAGASCKVSGQTKKLSGVTYACLKKGSKLSWQKYSPAKKPASGSAANTSPVDIKSGEYMVGSEIKPGIYRSNTSSCYYTRLSGFSGDFSDIISNGSTGANGGVIEILASDKGFSSRCTWYKIDPLVLATPTATKGSFTSGIWFVGGEIKAGIYRTTTKDCYYSRLSGFLGDIENIIANGSTGANGGIVEIPATDKAFSSRCDWTLISVDALRSATTTATKFASGQWIVGGEITPGTYRTTTKDCYYSRLSGFLGDIDDIIANGSTGANGGIIEISASDISFSSRCDWVKVG
jgi:hypothetical protein